MGAPVRARRRRRRHAHPHDLRAPASRSSSGFAAALVAMFIGGTVGLLAGYLGGKTDTGLKRLTDYFLRDPRHPADARDRGDLGTEPYEHHPDHRHHLLGDPSRRLVRAADEEPPRARLRAAGAIAGRGPHPRDRPPHPAPGRSDPDRDHRVARWPIAIFAETYVAFLGLGDPSLTSWGKLIAERIRVECHHGGCLVGDRPARGRRRDRRPRLHDDRPRDRGRPQPAPARRPPLRPSVPRPDDSRRARP